MEVGDINHLKLLGSKKRYDFKECFLKLCQEQKNVPTSKTLAAVSIDSFNLTINADRMKLSEWKAFFAALQIENTLEKIEIFSKRSNRHCPTYVEEDADTVLTAAASRGPIIFTRYILEKLLQNLTKSLARPESVCNSISIQLPLAAHYCSILGAGLPKASSNLQYISLSGSCVGDEGCSHLCEAIKTMHQVKVLDLSDCRLGVAALQSLAVVIHSHRLLRTSHAWETSFRYRSPQKDVCSGLIRITLNKNPDLGDEGAKKLVEILTDDPWIKAIDLQRCNLSDHGAKMLLEMLPSNLTIAIIDIRGNQQVSKYMLSCIEKALQSQPRNSDPEMQWLPFVPNKK